MTIWHRSTHLEPSMDIQAEFSRIVGQRRLEPEESDAVFEWLVETESMLTHEAPQSDEQAADMFDERVEL